MSTLLLKNLNTLVTCDDADSVLRSVDVYCEDGFIRAIGPHLPQTADTRHRRHPLLVLSRTRQHPPPSVSDLLPESGPGPESGAVRLAHRPVRNLEEAG